MSAMYRRIADDLAARISQGEWGIGEMLPPIAQLQEHYDGCALSTIRSAQQVLVDQGVLETISGRGAYVLRQPALGGGREQARRQLEAIRDASLDALRALDDTAHDNASRDPGYDALTGSWGYQQSVRCDTCDEDIRMVSRGWVDVENDVELYIAVGHDEHQLTYYYGLAPDEDQEIAFRREHWWERAAHLERAGELILEGEYQGAYAHAERARQILTADPRVDRFGIHLIGDGPQR